MLLLSSADFFFQKLTFSKKSFRTTIRVSNCLDPDQDQHLSVLIWVQTVFKGYQQMVVLPIVISALCAASQLPGEGPTDVEDAPTIMMMISR